MGQLLLWVKKRQFLHSVMDKRLSFVLIKRCGFKSSSISHFFFLLSFLFACLFVFILFFLYTQIYFLNLALRLFNKYTRRNVNNFNKLKRNTLCTLGEFNTFVVICWLLFKIKFFKASFRNTIRVSNVCIQIRAEVLSVLIWEQTVCKGNQQTTKVAAGKKRVRKPRK